jgi:hypothetical protein
VSKWRDQFKVHPAADVFPMMSDEELDELGKDIAENGLRTPITLWASSKNERVEALYLLLDGRNRLEALGRRGLGIGDLPRSECCPSNVVEGNKTYPGLVFLPNDVDPVAYIISANIKRRHLTKAQQADLIVAAIKAAEKPPEDQAVCKGGRGKVNPIRQKAMAAAKEHGIGKDTVERAMSRAEGKKKPEPKPKADGKKPKPEGPRAKARNAKAVRRFRQAVAAMEACGRSLFENVEIPDLNDDEEDSALAELKSARRSIGRVITKLEARKAEREVDGLVEKAKEAA